MMSMRTIARSAPRTLSRLSSANLRQPTIARPSSLKTAWAPLRSSQLTSSFSTTTFRRAPAGEVDEEFSLKLESELQFQNELKEQEVVPASIKDFLSNSAFELVDTPGVQEVTLKRKFGNENITVTFSVSDLSNYDPDMYNEDQALTDADLESPEAQRNAEAEESMEDDESEEPPVPIRLNVVIEKEGKGALNIEAVTSDTQIMIENFYYFKDPKMALAGSAEAVHAAGEAYPGPAFGSLDDDLQILMERYLEERGITQALAVFVPDYLDMKEEKEYNLWLKSVKDFVDA